MISANMYDTQAQYTAAAAKSKQQVEMAKANEAKPNASEITRSLPPTEATKQSDKIAAQFNSFQFTNSKNTEHERALNKQIKMQLQKDGYMTKAAMIAANYTTRSEKGQAMFGS